MSNNRLASALATASIIYLALAGSAAAQWTNRYPRVEDFRHHIYLEQHELPAMAHGPSDPAPAPDGKHIALAAQGWLWLLDTDTGIAERLTAGPHVDARPRWSADGKRLAFVRDTGSDTSIVVIDVESRREEVINTPTIELDPEFSADGEYLYYTSAADGSLNLWRRHLASGTDLKVTNLRQVERNARRVADGAGLLYLHGLEPHRVLRLRDFVAGTDEVVHAETLTYLLTADAHPGQRLIVYSAPIDNAYHLWTLDLDDPRVTNRLTEGQPYATAPAFSADGSHVYYVDLDESRRLTLMRVATHGGTPEAIPVREWNYGARTGTLAVAVTNADGTPVTARLSIASADGHPVAHPDDATHFDGQTGRHFFYVDGSTSFTLPVGTYTVLAARGPMAAVEESTVRVRSGDEAQVALELSPLWDAAAAGYASADHHVHLNGDGQFRADHDDALRATQGEDLDVLAPMSWNRWERRIDAPLLGIETRRGRHTIAQGQEVRSHFHGHIGLVGAGKPYAPWFFGPNNPTLGSADLTNGDVIAFAEATGALATYVHPVADDADPFAGDEVGYMPLELVSDSVLADRIGLELVCAWTSSLGTAEVWYRLLNIGKPVAAMSGTDAWVDFHRTPAVGTGRNYVRVTGEVTADAVLEAAAAGRGFVTTGPALLFEIGEDARPGDVIAAGPQQWRAALASTSDADVVELIVNGTVVERLEGVTAGETRSYEGDVTLPAGGWVAMRAYSSERVDDAWPTMHVRPFAHSSPVWIDSVGSTDPAARARAASDLVRAIDASQARAREAYGDVATPRMDARFEEARAVLREFAN
ncbi:MAG: CehA/McbA family metallohydrolase [Pseudomonadota bacterium]